MSLYFCFNSPEDRAKRRKADLQAIGITVTDFFWDVAPAHGFEMREGQQDMSCEIVDALIHNQHFAVEAGVGIENPLATWCLSFFTTKLKSR